MADRSRDERHREYDLDPRDRFLDGDEPKAATVFNPKGIGSNILLTSAAAVVPVMIIGTAVVKAWLGARRPRR